MNIALQVPKPTISAEAAQLLAILRDCGIDSVWRNSETKLLSFYLCNTTDNANDIKSEIGYENYALFLKHATFLWKYPQFGQEISIRHWFLRYADGSLLKQALQTSAREDLNTPAAKVAYNQQHPGFANDHADFAKLVTLLMLENFSDEIHHNHDFLVNRLNYYEYFRQQYGDIPLLNAFRRSIMRKEAENLADVKDYARVNGKQMKPKTGCTQKYINMTSYDRLRLIRYYRFVLAQEATGAGHE